MRNRVLWVLRFASLTVVLSGYLALATVQAYGVNILLLPAILFLVAPFAERLDRASTSYQVISKALLIAFIAFIPLMLIISGLVNTVLIVVIFIQVYTYLHDKKTLNYYHLYLMSFFLLLAACVQDPNAAIALVMLLFLANTVWGLIALRIYDELDNAEKHQQPDFFSLLSSTRKDSTGYANPYSLGLIFAVMLLTVVAIFLTGTVFFFTPRVEAGFLGRQNEDVDSDTVYEVRDNIVLGGDMSLSANMSIVMQAKLPDFPEGLDSESLYWRVFTMPMYSSNEWGRIQLQDHYDAASTVDWNEIEKTITRQSTRTSQEIRQIITLPNKVSKGLPTLDLVKEITLLDSMPFEALFWDGMRDFSINFDRSFNTSPRMQYEVVSQLNNPDPEMLRQDSGAYAEKISVRDLRYFLTENLLPETRALALEITDGMDSAYDKAVAIERFLSGPDFLYSLQFPELPLQNPIDAFILQRRVGHCQLYASSMALMLRSLDIPTRVVSGYLGAEWNEAEQSYFIRAKDAHLWVEVFFADYGWVRFDPSPRGIELVQENSPWVDYFNSVRTRSSLFWRSNFVDFRGMRSWDSLKNLSMSFITNPFSGSEEEMTLSGGDTTKQNSRSIFFVFLLVALSWLYYLLRKKNNKKPKQALSLTEDQERATRLYKKLLTKLAQAGIETEGHTAEEVLLQAQYAQIEDTAFIDDLIVQYNYARFGKRQLDSSLFMKMMTKLKSFRWRN